MTQRGVSLLVVWNVIHIYRCKTRNKKRLTISFGKNSAYIFEVVETFFVVPTRSTRFIRSITQFLFFVEYVVVIGKKVMTRRNYGFHRRATNFVRDIIEKIGNDDAVGRVDVKSRVVHVMVRRAQKTTIYCFNKDKNRSYSYFLRSVTGKHSLVSLFFLKGDPKIS